VFDFDDSAYEQLQTRHFGEEPNLDWLDLVCKCRSNPNYQHTYDIITGKIANDSVGETVQYVIAGIMRPEDALERLRFEQINNQICFCTAESLKFITFIKSEEV
jgi:hypothetical protein